MSPKNSITLMKYVAELEQNGLNTLLKKNQNIYEKLLKPNEVHCHNFVNTFLVICGLFFCSKMITIKTTLSNDTTEVV